MYRQFWVENHKAVCSINLYGSNNSHLYGITGFKVGNKIITDDFIYNRHDVREVVIRFYQQDGVSELASVRLGYHEFLYLLPEKEDYDNMGFAIIPADFPELKNTSSLTLSKSCNTGIGQEAVSFGYQYEHSNLSLKSAIVSSLYKNHRGLSFIQYDGTVKPGTTGGPLLNAHTGEVIGIIANKEMSITKNYLELMRIINSNLQALKMVEGRWKLDDIDPIQVLMAGQHQIKHIAKEFLRNATVRIGFALDIGHVNEYLEIFSESEVDLAYAFKA